MKIIVENTTKSIKGRPILQNVTLEMESGKIYGLQGPNGSGKTMLLRLISGLIRPTSGKVYVDNRQLGKDEDFPKSLGLLIENPAFLPNYTGLKNLELLASIKGKTDLQQIQNAISKVGLDPNDQRKFRKYSLGMKQRLGLAAAIMEKPDILLLDEPTNALDQNGIDQICQIIYEERDRGALVIMACHDATIINRMSDVIFTIRNGERNIRLPY